MVPIPAHHKGSLRYPYPPEPARWPTSAARRRPRFLMMNDAPIARELDIASASPMNFEPSSSGSAGFVKPRDAPSRIAKCSAPACSTKADAPSRSSIAPAAASRRTPFAPKPSFMASERETRTRAEARRGVRLRQSSPHTRKKSRTSESSERKNVRLDTSGLRESYRRRHHRRLHIVSRSHDNARPGAYRAGARTRDEPQTWRIIPQTP